MATRAQIIDDYAREKNYYPWIPYEPVGTVLLEEVERQGPNGLYDSTACALLEKEAGFKNVFGCDWGSRWTDVPPYCQVAVTKDRVKKLIANVEAGGGQNGIGTTQLTSIEYVYEAEKLGGAHIPRYQMRVGFRVLLEHILNLGWPAGAAAYNAGAGNWRSVINTYGADMQRLEREWAHRLAQAADKAPDGPQEKVYEVRASRRFAHGPTARRVAAGINDRVRLPSNMEFKVVERPKNPKVTDPPKGGEGINLGKYKATDKYGLTPHTDRARQHLEEVLGPFTWFSGYRAESNTPVQNRTEHPTRRAIDLGFPYKDKARADEICGYLIEYGDELEVEGLICWAGQTGYGQPLGVWIPQRWTPPANWQELGYEDPWHFGHGHILFRR